MQAYSASISWTRISTCHCRCCTISALVSAAYSLSVTCQQSRSSVSDSISGESPHAVHILVPNVAFSFISLAYPYLMRKIEVEVLLSCWQAEQ